MMKNEPRITYQRRTEASIEDYVEDAKRIFPLNAKRSPLHIWMEAVGWASKVGEGVRKLEWDSVIYELATFTMWWFAFVGRANSLDESDGDLVILRLPHSAGGILWRNYPDVCPGCVCEFLRKHKEQKEFDAKQVADSLGPVCTCFLSKRSVEARDELVKERAQQLTKEISELCCDRKPKTLVKYGEQFASLYAPNAYGLSPERDCLPPSGGGRGGLRCSCGSDFL